MENYFSMPEFKGSRRFSLVRMINLPVFHCILLGVFAIYFTAAKRRCRTLFPGNDATAELVTH
jgi:hypothetical protein